MLIKAVALSIPTYAMKCYKLSGSLCFELESMMARFYWGQKKNEKIHWINWYKMCESEFRECCFKDLRTFNVALLAKQRWIIFQEEDSMHKIYKIKNKKNKKYFPKINVFLVYFGQ